MDGISIGDNYPEGVMCLFYKLLILYWHKPSNLSKLIKGERPVNYDQALIFGKLFNHNPMLWIEIQAKNELKRLLNVKDKKYSFYSLSDLIKKRKNAV